MPRYRDGLPQLAPDVFLTDSGLQTDLIFHKGVDLPDFAAFVLLRQPEGRELLRAYFIEHAEVAKEAGVGFHPGVGDLANQPGLGQQAGLRRHRARRGEPRRHRLVGGGSRRSADVRADGPQRLRRPAW